MCVTHATAGWVRISIALAPENAFAYLSVAIANAFRMLAALGIEQQHLFPDGINVTGPDGTCIAAAIHSAACTLIMQPLAGGVAAAQSQMQLQTQSQTQSQTPVQPEASSLQTQAQDLAPVPALASAPVPAFTSVPVPELASAPAPSPALVSVPVHDLREEALIRVRGRAVRAGGAPNFALKTERARRASRNYVQSTVGNHALTSSALDWICARLEASTAEP